MPSTSPTLWVIATPIGNLGDFSPRAREILGSVNTIFAEDTRRAMHLCQLCNIYGKRFVSFFDHNEQERKGEALDLLRQGQDIALVSDAGTPLMADPGYRLVRACHAEGFRVCPIPGPSAPVVALSVAGIPPIPYTFLGFLPRQASEQIQIFKTFAQIPTTLVFFERKDRLAATMARAFQHLGAREFAICRELTKVHEEIVRGRLDTLDILPPELQGELTILIGPPAHQARTPEHEVVEILEEALAYSGKQREILRKVQSDIVGWSSKELYSLLGTLKNNTASRHGEG